MLLNLDVDCWNIICDYLQLKDQFMLIEVNSYLQNIMEDRLKRSFKKISFLTEFWRTKENEFYVPVLLKATVETVENIEIMGNTIMANKDCLKHLTFEKVTSLYICLSECVYEPEEVLPFVAKLFPNVVEIKIFCESSDNVLEIIAALYPNIKKVKLYAQCTGKNVVKMKNLQELFLHTGGKVFHGKLLSRLCRAPQLKRLTYLRFSGCSPLLDIVNYVENLQELTILHLDYEGLKKAEVFKIMKSLQKIAVYEYPDRVIQLDLQDKYFYRQLHGFSLSRRYASCMELVVDAPKLRTLRFHREIYIFPDFYNGEAKPLQHLEELYFLFSITKEEKTKQNLLTLVAHNPKLRLLDISGTKFNIGFVKNLISILKGQNRQNSLLFRCHNTEISWEDIRCLKLPEYLKVSFEKLEYDLPNTTTTVSQFYLSDQLPNEE